MTSLTSERDGQTLELLLATEVTPKEFIFGKLGGVMFNMKEVILVPLVFFDDGVVSGPDFSGVADLCTAGIPDSCHVRRFAWTSFGTDLRKLTLGDSE